MARRKRKAEPDRWGEYFRHGYCYHSTIKGYKTATLIDKWREGWGNPKQRRNIAYELSLRDADLALAEVRASVSDLNEANAALLLSLHHVADAETARTLFAIEGFDPDALHLSAFTALLDDFLAALPNLDAAEAERRLRRLGFLNGPVTNPMVDGPSESEAYRTSSERYDALIVRFLCGVYPSPQVVALRSALAEHLRTTYKAEAYVFLFEQWEVNAASAIDVFAGVSRIGFKRANDFLGDEGFSKLVREFCEELAGPAQRFESKALKNGWLPAKAKDLPRDHARAIATVFLESERHEEDREAAAEVLLGLGDSGLVLDHAATLPSALLIKTAKMLPYHEALRHLPAGHAALLAHDDAPPNMALVGEAIELAPSNPTKACALLASIAADARHPLRDDAFTHLLAFARAKQPDLHRRMSLHHLGQLADARATPALLEALDDPKLASSRLMILTALTFAADSRAVPALRRLAEQEPPVAGAAQALAAAMRR